MAFSKSQKPGKTFGGNSCAVVFKLVVKYKVERLSRKDPTETGNLEGRKNQARSIPGRGLDHHDEAELV